MSAENSLRIGGGFPPPANPNDDRKDPPTGIPRSGRFSTSASKEETKRAYQERYHGSRLYPQPSLPSCSGEPPLTAMRPASTQCWQKIPRLPLITCKRCKNLSLFCQR